MKWVLKYHKTGEEKELFEWGVSNLNRNTFSLAVDTLTMTHEGADVDSEPIFAEGEIISVSQISDSGVRTGWFYGRVNQVNRQASGSQENLHYTICGPWWWLENLVFQQTWKVLLDPSDPSSLGTAYKSHLLLNLRVDGAKLNTGAQIKEAFDYAISNGAPFTLGATDVYPTVEVPIDEIVDLTCAEVIIRQLRYSPEFVLWVDYQPEIPVIRLVGRDALIPVYLPFTEVIEQLQITRRADLILPAVVIKYETTNQFNGYAYPLLSVDAYPTDEVGTKFGSIVSTISLEGAIGTVLAADLTCLTIDPSDSNWWKSKDDTLGRDTIKNIKIENVSRSTDLPREIRGNYAPWMGGQVVEETIKAQISYDVVDSNGAVLTSHIKQEFSTTILATNLTTNSYRTVTDFTPAEPQPIGLAQALYLAANREQWSGELLLVAEELSDQVRLGNALNVVGAKTEWATMNAQISEIHENLDRGTTTVVLGLRRHLGRDDIMALLRMNRKRPRYTALATRTSGQPSSGRALSIGEKPEKNNTQKGAGTLDKIVIGTAITLDKADVLTDPTTQALRQLKVREEKVCEEQADGTFKDRYMLVLCSEKYDK